MKDPTFYIQSEFYRVLNGNLSYAGQSVSVSSLEQPANESGGLYVNFATSYLLPNKSKDKFRPAVRLQIDIVNQLLGDELTTEKVENISNQICQLIIPTPSTHAINGNSDWGIVKVDLYDARYLNLRNETNYIVRKYLVFEILTQQK